MDILHSDQTVVFAAGSTVSSEIDLRNIQLKGIVTDAAFVTGSLTFKASTVSGASKLNCLDYAGVAVDLTGILALQYYILNSDITEALMYVTLTSSVVQTAGTTITLITKERA